MAVFQSFVTVQTSVEKGVQFLVGRHFHSAQGNVDLEIKRKYKLHVSTSARVAFFPLKAANLFS